MVYYAMDYLSSFDVSCPSWFSGLLIAWIQHNLLFLIHLSTDQVYQGVKSCLQAERRIQVCENLWASAVRSLRKTLLLQVYQGVVRPAEISMDVSMLQHSDRA